MPRKRNPTPTPAERAQRRAARPMTEKRLENIATFYLQRFSTSVAHLRQVLQRRAARSNRAQKDGAHANTMAAVWIDRLIARFVASGVLNDLSYGERQAEKLRAKGKSAQAIRTALKAKGLESAAIDQALRRTADSADDAALKAALAYARRRKLGPFRPGLCDRATAQKDLGTLARAGFSYHIARQVLAASADES